VRGTSQSPPASGSRHLIPQTLRRPPTRAPAKSNFIAAARRAAQAAAAANTEKPGRLTAATDAARSAAAKAGLNIRTARPAAATDAPKPSRTRPLLVGVSVVLIVLRGFRLAMNFLDGGESAPPEKSSVTAPAPEATPPADPKQKSEAAPVSNPCSPRDRGRAANLDRARAFGAC